MSHRLSGICLNREGPLRDGRHTVRWIAAAHTGQNAINTGQATAISGNQQRERERKMAVWPFPDGIAFNPYYRVLLGTCRLETSDKLGSNATVNLHLYVFINKKGTRALWSGSTWRGLCSWRCSSSVFMHLHFPLSKAGVTQRLHFVPPFCEIALNVINNNCMMTITVFPHPSIHG